MDTVVCVLEAMKVFTEVPADMSGTITEILVSDGEFVEFGQPLFKIKTR
jgi:acetyl-CoA carboxylase biotin carboxyl carrier protein